MPGREDFAIIKARLFGDDRAHAVAADLVRLGLAKQPCELLTVIGLVAALGLWTSRETSNGVLPGDGVSALRAALGVDESHAKALLKSLRRRELLRKAPNGFYLVGFRDCYRPLVRKRRKDKERKAKWRADLSAGRPSDVRATSSGRPSGVQTHRTGPDRTGPDPPKSPLGPVGDGAATGPVGGPAAPTTEKLHVAAILGSLAGKSA